MQYQFSKLVGRGAANRRANPRLPMDDVWCEQGKIIDLSMTGAQLRRLGFKGWDNGQTHELVLGCGEKAMKLKARIVWTQGGFMHRSHGLEFVEMDEVQLHAISKIASDGRNRCVVTGAA